VLRSWPRFFSLSLPPIFPIRAPTALGSRLSVSRLFKYQPGREPRSYGSDDRPSGCLAVTMLFQSPSLLFLFWFVEWFWLFLVLHFAALGIDRRSKVQGCRCVSRLQCRPAANFFVLAVFAPACETQPYPSGSASPLFTSRTVTSVFSRLVPKVFQEGLRPPLFPFVLFGFLRFLS